ncbi:MAG: acyltransferase [Gammaproteobacteria bacterium]|nr:acyltransferase [Gammaproteobacteria bacterium]MDH4315383.1 acyltransferase [Gammaproteobacteria bacterium]MDH5214088.1 acyltransferase [Gammaproteobacteria bacterium]MDH5500056.1 acyltransferase [Gammaproteobacteria bacterium]
MTHPVHTGPIRYDIQGLRAVAIALVVLAHASVPGFAGGFIGVDVFFVLSGYLITGLLVRERLSSGSVRYVQFLARRLRRLLPAMTVMLVLVLLLSAVLLSDYELRMQAGSFAYAATWTSNFFFSLSDFDYFAALQGKDLFLHTWSLAVEEQFYLIWPWLVLLAFLLSGTSLASGDRRVTILCLLAFTFIVSLALCLHWSQYEPLLSFYMMPSRGWQFALGAAVFAGLHDFGESASDSTNVATRTALLAAFGIAGILMIIGSAVWLNAELVYPGYFALIPSIGAALMIASGHSVGVTRLNRLLSSKAFVWVGDRSYSLYLWHWPVLLLGDAFGINRTPVGVAVLVGISVLLATSSYRFVELPFWKGRFSNATPSRTVLASIGIVVIAIATGQGLRANVFGEPQVTAAQGDYNPRRDVPDLYDAQRNCDTYYHSAEIEPCFEGPEDARYTAVLFGDSIGAQWVSLIEGIYRAPEWRVLILTKSACPIVDEDYYYAPVGGIYEICSGWRDAAIGYLAGIKPDVVFVGSSSHYAFSPAQWIDGATRVLSELSESATRVVVIPGTPELSFDGPTCIESPYRFSFLLTDSRRECEEGVASKAHELVADHLEQAARGFENVRVLDLTELVCPGNRCAAQSTSGMTVFRDKRHLTETFVRSLVPSVLDQLERSQAGPEFLKEFATLASSQ